MPLSLITAIVLAALAILFAWLGFRRLRQRSIASGIKLETLSMLLFVAAAVMVLLAANMLVYQRLSYETPVARIHFEQLSSQSFRAALKLADGNTQQFTLQGDEWQLDAHILKWHSFANLFGLDAQYRLNRLSGRYKKIEQARREPQSVFNIGDPPLFDLWELTARYGKGLNWLVDAAYGSAVFLPMSNNAEYEIHLSQSGLVARPVNQAAKKAVSRWIGL